MHSAPEALPQPGQGGAAKAGARLNGRRTCHCCGLASCGWHCRRRLCCFCCFAAALLAQLASWCSCVRWLLSSIGASLRLRLWLGGRRLQRAGQPVQVIYG